MKPELLHISIARTVTAAGAPAGGLRDFAFTQEIGTDAATICAGMPVAQRSHLPKQESLLKPTGGKHITIEVPTQINEDHAYGMMTLLWWWAHIGLEKPLQTDVTTDSMPDRLNDFYRAYKQFVWRMAKAVTIDPEHTINRGINVYDPYFFSSIAKILKHTALKENDSQFIAHNYISFPAPEDFQMLLDAFAGDKKMKLFIEAYLVDWLHFDTIVFLSDRDRQNFLASVAAWVCPELQEKFQPKLEVIPLGANTDRAADAIEHYKSEPEIAEQTGRELLEDARKYVEPGKGFQQITDISGQRIFYNVGTRSCPSKRIPDVIDALETILRDNPEMIGTLCYVQQVRPHRQDKPSYRAEFESIQEKARELNRLYATEHWQPIVLIDHAIPNGNVYYTDMLLTELADRSAFMHIGREGMGVAPQEALLAASEMNVVLSSSENGFGSFVSEENRFNATGTLDHDALVSLMLSFIWASEADIKDAHIQTKAKIRRLDLRKRSERVAAVIRSE